MSAVEWATAAGAYALIGAIFSLILLIRRTVIELNLKRREGWREVVKQSRERYVFNGMQDETRYLLYGLIWPVSLLGLSLESLLRFFLWAESRRGREESEDKTFKWAKTKGMKKVTYRDTAIADESYIKQTRQGEEK